MITQYHRPQTLEEALRLLAQPRTRPLGGGSWLSRKTAPDFAVVDVQNLGLDGIASGGRRLEIGAAARLQALLEAAAELPALQKALRLEAPRNLRNMRTLAGALLTADGGSPLAAVMMALDASVRRMVWNAPGAPAEEETLPVGEVLLERRTSPDRRQLILAFGLPLNVRLGFEYVSRTPSDRPLLCAAAAQWPSGRTRLVMGGWGDAPALAMDGPEAAGLSAAARNACYEAEDSRASAEYRREVAPILARRAAGMSESAD